MADVKLSKVIYDRYLDTYRQFTKKENEIHMLWQFDTVLKPLLLKYTLVAEQILNSKLISLIYKEVPRLDQIMEEHGKKKFMKKVQQFNRVPDSFMNKTFRVLQDKNIEGRTFDLYVQYSTFSQFLKLVEHMDIFFRDRYFDIIRKQTKMDWNDMDILTGIRAISYIRNICAHNGQLLLPHVMEELKKIADRDSIAGVMQFLRDLLNSTNAEHDFDMEYGNIYERYKKLLESKSIWQ